MMWDKVGRPRWRAVIVMLVKAVGPVLGRKSLLGTEDGWIDGMSERFPTLGR